ncbi:hypothetical protein GCM10022246_04450 [Pedobacter ginsengiterrae]|uniref:FecR protein domain-containing protein n=1 Tax=Pedobacter ginsengiterrae TaxID=871696 RepID=A0ABP7NSY3_9SPHI
MEINRRLIEKYHLDECTEEERKLVEAWLFSTDIEDLAILPLNEDKLDHKKQMWANIDAFITPDLKADQAKNTTIVFWQGAIAASLVIGLICGLLYLFVNKQEKLPDFVSVNNAYSENVKHVNSLEFNAAIGPNTIAKINKDAGVINLNGSILLSPKKDIELIFEGTHKKITLKKGQTYIILDNKSGKQGIIVVSQKNLLDLPPVIQKQISSQFDI